MNIYLTSFFRIQKLPEGVVPHSCAVYQPKGYFLPKVDWTDIRVDGRWQRPRDFVDQPNPLEAYRLALLNTYYSRIDEAEAWADSLDTDVALCCWCPYDKAGRRQLEQWGSFVCHTAVLSEFINEALGLPVWEDADRRKMAVLTQRTLTI